MCMRLTLLKNIILLVCLSSAGTVGAQAIEEVHTFKEITNSIGMKLILMPRGSFKMGAPIEEAGADDDEAQHQVTITKTYYLSVTEVTQREFNKVMGYNPSLTRPRGREALGLRSGEKPYYQLNPVEYVSWEDAVKFCKKLSDSTEEKKAGRVYRLPTEAEWEKACRALSNTAYSFGDSSESLESYAWFKENSTGFDGQTSRLMTVEVRKKQPNPFGLYDMHGNVWEWCGDWYGEYPNGAVIDPVGPREGSSRVIRGGHYRSGPERCRSAERSRADPTYKHERIGFRVALDSSGIPQ